MEGRRAMTSSRPALAGQSPIRGADTLSTAMAFIGFHHVQLAMPPGGERDAAAFYCDVLGFEQVPKPAHLAARGGCWFRSGHVELHLGVEDPFVPARRAHPAVLVSGLDELRAALTEAGIEIILDTQLEGEERFYAHDPFGNRLEFIGALVSPDS
jgi:catechol 2,3-dioxygenase-like lactoylglutathione lyase family enzyme